MYISKIENEIQTYINILFYIFITFTMLGFLSAKRCGHKKYEFCWTIRNNVNRALSVSTTESVYNVVVDTLNEIQQSSEGTNTMIIDLLSPGEKGGYDLTEKDVSAILNHIKVNKTITNFAIKAILSPELNESVEIRPLVVIKHAIETRKLVKFKHQREENKEHIDSIKKYILNSYTSNSFTLSSLHVCKNEYGAEEVIDGMHRCKAISQIDDDEPCMRHNIVVTIHPCISMTDKLTLFKSLNKAKSIDKFDFEEEELKRMRDEVKQKFLAIYRNSIYDTVKKSEYYDRICINDLFEIVTTAELNKMSDREYIKDFTSDEICQFLQKLNNHLLQKFHAIHPSLFISRCTLTPEQIQAAYVICNKINNTNKYSSVMFNLFVNSVLRDTNPMILGILHNPKYTFVDIAKYVFQNRKIKYKYT